MVCGWDISIHVGKFEDRDEEHAENHGKPKNKTGETCNCEYH